MNFIIRDSLYIVLLNNKLIDSNTIQNLEVLNLEDKYILYPDDIVFFGFILS